VRTSVYCWRSESDAFGVTKRHEEGRAVQIRLSIEDLSQKEPRLCGEVPGLCEGQPEGVAFFYHGAVAHGEVANTLALHDVFVLPTLGENFCHAIAEALAAGVPCLVSDRTPWNDLGRTGAGWSVPLEDQSEWIARLQHCVDLGAEAHGEAAAAALRLVESRNAESSDFEPALAA
jgi:glycosyltransferase involved in cell wall biosynthesis